MPLSDAHVGRTYPATEPYLVSREKIVEFADALGDRNPAHRGPDPVAPPTFAVVLVSRAWDQLFGDPELDLSLARTIHVDQAFTYERPLRAGDEVVATLTIEKVRVRGASAVITIGTVLATLGGEQVVTARSTLMHTWPSEEGQA